MQFLVDNSIYVTLIITMLIMIGLLLYMWRVDARLKALETAEGARDERVADHSLSGSRGSLERVESNL